MVANMNSPILDDAVPTFFPPKALSNLLKKPTISANSSVSQRPMVGAMKWVEILEETTGAMNLLAPFLQGNSWKFKRTYSESKHV